MGVGNQMSKGAVKVPGGSTLTLPQVNSCPQYETLALYKYLTYLLTYIASL